MSKPPAVLIGGPPASGKTTLAAALAPELHAALIDLDVATGPLTRIVVDLIGAADFSDPDVAARTRTARYETLLALAEDSLRAGTPAVVVAPFTAERDSQAWAAVERRLGACSELTFVWLNLSRQQLTERLVGRAAERDVGKLANPDAYLASVSPHAPAAAHLALDAARPVRELVRAVLDHLEN